MAGATKESRYKMVNDDPKCLEHSGFCRVIETFEKKILEGEKGVEEMENRIKKVEDCLLEWKATLNSAYWVGSVLVTVCAFIGSYVIPHFLQ